MRSLSRQINRLNTDKHPLEALVRIIDKLFPPKCTPK